MRRVLITCRAGRQALIATVLLVVTACGFRFEGYSTWPAGWPGYALSNQLEGLAGEDFEQLLRRELSLLGVEEGAEPVARLELRRLEQRKIISALDASGQAAQFELQRRLRFIVTADGQRSPELEVVAQRRLSFDPNLVLAKQQEEAQIIEALSRELVQLMLLRVEAELRALRVPRR